MSATPYIGSSISLISKAEIRYEGKLFSVDLQESTVTLANVRSFGTEDRCEDKVIPPRKEVYEYIVFRGQDIKELNVSKPPTSKETPRPPPQDPAIIHSATMGSPGGLPYRPPPYQSPSPGVFSPFGGLPYTNYPVGFQPPPQQFQERPMPGIRPQMPMTPGANLLPRNLTPPIPGAAMSRNSTPSPDSLVHSSELLVKTQETQTKNTAQQATQTTKKKPSSRRSSVDKTHEKENKKPDESSKELSKESSKEKTEERPQQERKSSNENRSRGSNRRPQGKRGGYRGSRRDSKPKEFEDEYDFESANAKFNKEEVEEEWHKKLGLVLTLSDEVEVEGEEQSGASNHSPEPTTYYNKASFFDSISCEAKDRDKNRKAHPSWAEERKLNTETFGAYGIRRGRGGYRGRGRGSYRGRGGGRGGFRGRGRGGGRGGRGGNRGGGNTGWVDYPLDADSSKLQQNLPSGTTTPSQNQAEVQA